MEGKRRRRRLVKAGFLCFFKVCMHLLSKRSYQWLSNFFFPFLEIFFSRDEYFKTFQERGDVNVFLVKWKYFKFLSTTPLSLSVCIYFNSLRSWFEQCLNFRACIVSRINDVPLTFYFIYRARRIAFFRSWGSPTRFISLSLSIHVPFLFLSYYLPLSYVPTNCVKPFQFNNITTSFFFLRL